MCITEPSCSSDKNLTSTGEQRPISFTPSLAKLVLPNATHHFVYPTKRKSSIITSDMFTNSPDLILLCVSLNA